MKSESPGLRVVLVAPHWLFVYEQYAELSRAINFHPPLGLATLSACLEQAGHEGLVLDAEGQGLRFEEVITRVQQFQPDLVGITITTPVLGSARKLATALKNVMSDVPVVVGGPHITLTGAESLEGVPEFDYGLRGEAEVSLPKLAGALASKASVEQIPGVIYRNREKQKVILGPDNNELLPLDDLPMPDRSKLDMDRYIWSVPGHGLRVMASIQASRGCPLRCIFCSEDRMYPRAVRFKSVDRVLAELDHIKLNTEAKHVVFLDDTITLNRRWAIELFTRMRDANLGFTWEGESTANRIDDELVQLMKASGLTRMNFGIESGDPEILERLGKGVKLHEIAPAYRLLKKYGIETRGSVMLGNPYETRKTVWRTLRFIWSLRDLDQAYINIAAPYPGTVLREMALRGEGGVELLDPRYEALRRYGGGVMRVNDLTPEYLARVQRVGTLGFYAQPRRVMYNFRRAGGRAMFRNLAAFLRTGGDKEAPVQMPSAI